MVRTFLHHILDRSLMIRSGIRWLRCANKIVDLQEGNRAVGDLIQLDRICHFGLLELGPT